MGDLLTVCDQMDREVTFSFPPRRIVSLVPSQTEYLIDIGAPVVGRTKFCIHPGGVVKEIPVVGGTKKFRFEEIGKLKPDLIIGNKEENYQEGISILEKKFPVWMSDIYSLEDAFNMMTTVGHLCDLEDSSDQVVKECKRAIEKVKNSKMGTVIYLIWRNPWMAAGKNTFIDHLIDHLGFENVLLDGRYPELTTDQIQSLRPERILLSSEPYPFKENHLHELQSVFPNAEIELVDGELYSWYGSRLRYWRS